eukprot:9196799-Pyramimonas_sp.AAC.1
MITARRRSQKGREHIPVAGANHRRGENIRTARDLLRRVLGSPVAPSAALGATQEDEEYVSTRLRSLLVLRDHTV